MSSIEGTVRSGFLERRRGGKGAEEGRRRGEGKAEEGRRRGRRWGGGGAEEGRRTLKIQGGACRAWRVGEVINIHTNEGER